MEYKVGNLRFLNMKKYPVYVSNGYKNGIKSIKSEIIGCLALSLRA